jgi:hypothetical protein
MRVPSASICVTVVMPSPENGALRTIGALTFVLLRKSIVCAATVHGAAASHAAALATVILFSDLMASAPGPLQRGQI